MDLSGDNIDPNKEFLNPGLVDEAPVVPSEHVHLTQVRDTSKEKCCKFFGLFFVRKYLYKISFELLKMECIKIK